MNGNLISDPGIFRVVPLGYFHFNAISLVVVKCEMPVPIRHQVHGAELRPAGVE